MLIRVAVKNCILRNCLDKVIKNQQDIIKKLSALVLLALDMIFTFAVF